MINPKKVVGEVIVLILSQPYRLKHVLHRKRNETGSQMMLFKIIARVAKVRLDMFLLEAKELKLVDYSSPFLLQYINTGQLHKH